MKWDIPGYLRNTSNQTVFWSEALRFCALTVSECGDILHFVFAILVDYFHRFGEYFLSCSDLLLAKGRFLHNQL